MSPGILLAGLLVLIAAQANQLLAPRPSHYLLALLAAAAGLVAGELVALSGHGGPAVGAVHPVADVLGMTAAEAVALILGPRRDAAHR